MTEIRHRFVDTNGIRMHIAEAGEGPLVVMCHGFPESWYSWRHQLVALADAGFHAVAPDQRGYGQTDKPPAIEDYTLLHLVGDIVGLLDALGAPTAVIVGHDWGAPVAWHAALLRPDRFRAVVGLSVPFRGAAPRGRPPRCRRPTTRSSISSISRRRASPKRSSSAIRATRSDACCSGDPATRDNPPCQSAAAVVTSAWFRATAASSADATRPPTLPAWITEADVDFYAGEFARSGFRGGLNWYRNIDRNWELFAPWAGAGVTVPALYVAGDRDLVLGFKGMDRLLPALKHFAPNLRDTIILPGCGHWTQQERPAEVNAALLKFLRGL